MTRKRSPATQLAYERRDFKETLAGRDREIRRLKDEIRLLESQVAVLQAWKDGVLFERKRNLPSDSE